MEITFFIAFLAVYLIGRWVGFHAGVRSERRKANENLWHELRHKNGI